MRKLWQARLWVGGGAVATALAGAATPASAMARTPSISGGWPVALILLLVCIVMLFVLVRAVLFLDERDAWLRRGGGDGNDWTFPD